MRRLSEFSVVHHAVKILQVQNLYAAVFGDEQVLRVEVTMHDALFVSCRKSIGNLNAVVDRLAYRHQAVRQLLPQRAALQ